ncbi:hypothetical protein TRFO_06084 [Tritrichomonas foetus]|uniref:Uncharacterized protein n=1 Tax=Tritrichomonas foetus TaxID=1144522 RepID=A0A1J4K0X8_9EUKA|nr:hypothetical protein TRFO_06084 [Tritrichomonas foetus]|eukprot:OHT05081.1 hypothetical protein TRFO_06084 [Tritrichomonas foetus]
MNESITPELIFQQALQQTQGNVINLIAGLFQFSHQVRPEENRLPLFSRLMEIYEVKIQLDIQVRQQLLEFFSKQIDAIIPDLSYQLIVVRTLYSMCMTLFPQFQEFFFQRLSSFLNAANMETPDFFFCSIFLTPFQNLFKFIFKTQSSVILSIFYQFHSNI